MGIYLFNTDVLHSRADEVMPRIPTPNTTSATISCPAVLGKYRKFACLSTFVDENKQHALYWRDVGTLEAYYEANIDVASRAANRCSTCTTSPGPCAHGAYQYPPAKFVFGEPLAGPAWRSTRSFRLPLPLFPDRWCATQFVSHDVRVNSATADVDSSRSSSRTSTSAGTAASATPSSTVTSTSRMAPSSATTRQRGQEELLRHAVRPDHRHTRLLRIRKPGEPGVYGKRQRILRAVLLIVLC